jgi:hypothetical protein
MRTTQNLVAHFLGLSEPNKNQILCGKGILGQDQVIFTVYSPLSGVKDRKNTRDQVFSITKKTTASAAELHPRGKTVTAAYIHKALAKI